MDDIPPPRHGHPAPPASDHLVREGAEAWAGTHLILDIEGGSGLDDPAAIEAALRASVAATGATLLHLHAHRFSPQGVTAVAVLAESHIACHTWPEIGYAAVDLFMCGRTDPHAAIPVLARHFATDRIAVTELRRGRIAGAIRP